jgi:hypothetical protein
VASELGLPLAGTPLVRWSRIKETKFTKPPGAITGLLYSHTKGTCCFCPSTEASSRCKTYGCNELLCATCTPSTEGFCTSHYPASCQRVQESKVPALCVNLHRGCPSNSIGAVIQCPQCKQHTCLACRMALCSDSDPIRHAQTALDHCAGECSVDRENNLANPIVFVCQAPICIHPHDPQLLQPTTCSKNIRDSRSSISLMLDAWLAEVQYNPGDQSRCCISFVGRSTKQRPRTHA